jgi:L-alanine-DL-glutamate epimerase-like enolase superfamily enzyme
LRIVHTELQIQREPFVRPFAIKGSSFREKWNLIVRLRDASGCEAVGVGGNAVLWSDTDVFSSHTEVGGNLLMASCLEFALQQAKEGEWPGPMQMMADLLPEVYRYGKSVTGSESLRKTFALVSLVALDNAAWMLHARQHGIGAFDELVPPDYRRLLGVRQERVSVAPAVGYNLPDEQVHGLLEAGVYVLKVKIGHPGDEEEMLAQDVSRLEVVHRIAEGYRTPMTESGRILYYVDANGRYPSREAVVRLVEQLETRGILDRVLMVEEPYLDPRGQDVSGLPVRFCADESLEDPTDVKVRWDQGYRAMAIKPAGKTLSLAFQMLEAAQDVGADCVVADSGCVPLLVEWNKNVAARLPAFPGLRGGLMESNGPENYGRWAEMLAHYPIPDAPWLRPVSGSFELDSQYYDCSGGIFENPACYSALLPS